MVPPPPVIADLDRRLVAVAKDIKVLSALAWPQSISQTFLKGWHAGNPILPRPTYQLPDLSASATELGAIIAACPADDLLGGFIQRTARSYLRTIEMLDHVGKARFLEISTQIYGLPTDRIGDTGPTNREAAQAFIAATAEYLPAFAEVQVPYCIRPEAVRDTVADAANAAFPGRRIEVVIDDALAAKAAAGIDRVRIRGGTSFAEVDIPQLIEHELLVHTLTSVNGAEQPHLTCMSLGAPRTTATQEGLAVFAELVTGAMDLNRLRRIAMRVEGIQLAIEGADFIDVFKFFLDAGSAETEAFQSTARVFRGGDPRGGIAFTKDAVYLHGLLAVHTFLRKAIRDNRLGYPTRLFSGRLSLADVIDLAPCFDAGLITEPRFTPPWLSRRSNLTAFLTFSNFLNRIRLDAIDIESLLVDPPC